MVFLFYFQNDTNYGLLGKLLSTTGKENIMLKLTSIKLEAIMKIEVNLQISEHEKIMFSPAFEIGFQLAQTQQFPIRIIFPFIETVN